MKPISKLYLKIFLTTGIPYGFMMLGSDLISGKGFNLWRFLFLTFFFGISMSLILVFFHKKKLKEIGVKEYTNNDIRIFQIKSIKSEINKKELICNLKNSPLLKKMKIEDTENEIVLKTRMSFKSWGEIIKITLKSSNDSFFEYEVSSRPKLKLTLIDYGKNRHNISLIENILK